jgi:sugar phosphate isomerase/epimerase
MKNQLCVSSYSLRQHLGPIRGAFRGPDGQKEPFVWEQPQTMTLLEFPQQVREHLAIDAVELCQFHLPERGPAYLDQLKRALGEADVRLVNMPIDVGNISDANRDYREEDLAEIEEWMRAAAELGAGYVRVNASAPLGKEQLAPLEVTIESYRRLARTAESLGLQLLIENHGGITTDPSVIVRIVEEVGPAQLKTLVDIGNFEPLLSMQMAVIQGREPPTTLDTTPLYGAIAQIAPYAGLVHAKTHGFDQQGRPLHMDVVRALRVVRDAGFAGPISLEYEGSEGDAWENTRRTRALVEEAFA